MKKFLKVFIIVLLVLASIAGTCFVFFKNIKKKTGATLNILQALDLEDVSEFRNDLKTVRGYVVSSDKLDLRLDLIIATNEKLDDIAESVSSYYIQTETNINNKRLVQALQQVKSSRSSLIAMLDEFEIKKNSNYFNRHTGANDLYIQSCRYLTNYARFLNYLNNDLNLNKVSDIKFSAFDVYINVVLISFEKTKISNNLVYIENDKNINKANSLIEINDSFVETKIDQFAQEINLFNGAYYNCNKMEFAKDLADNLATVNSAQQSSSEKVAAYYFKQIFGV